MHRKQLSCTVCPLIEGTRSTDEVMSGPQSVIYAQAENRMHVEKGILVELLKPLK